MAYDEAIADRLRVVLRRRKGVSERRMFGGIAFLINGNMCCGVVDDKIVLRLGEQGAADALTERHTREMDFTGRPLKTMVYVQPTGFRTDADLRAWVGRAVAFTRTLPPK